MLIGGAMGVTDINALTEDPIAAIKALGGAHAAISVAVAPTAFEQAFGSLRRGGTLVFVALPADNFVSLPIFETVLNGITILGSIAGTRKDLAEVYAIHAQGRTRVIRETRRLEEVNDRFEKSRRVTSRPVSSSTCADQLLDGVWFRDPSPNTASRGTSPDRCARWPVGCAASIREPSRRVRRLAEAVRRAVHGLCED